MSSFSRTISNPPRVIKDSSGATLYAFNTDQINTIIKKLKENDVNKKIIIQLQSEVALLKADNKLFSTVQDSLNQQVKTYLEIKINLEGEVSIKNNIIDSLNQNIVDYKLTDTNYNKEISDYKLKIKKKNGTIVKLVCINVATVVLLVLVLIHN